jgi:hypothetical protein
MTPLTSLAVSSLLAAFPTPAAHSAPEAVAVVVRIPTPWWAPRFLVRRRFAQAVPEYARAPGLIRKAFTISDDGRFGGAYLWRSRADVDAWFDARWFARVRRRYGADADVLVIERALDLVGPAGAAGEPVGPGALRGDARLLLLEAAGAGRPDPAALRDALGAGLANLTVGEREGRPVALALFASAEAARAAAARPREALEAALGGTFALTGFEAPVLLRNAP